ncbi:MAG: hypothetical protein E7396_10040, partial [Ruminococcaceae bacterium]|nr:hypothetical protein [Oscillospiraceae bacterium]
MPLYEDKHNAENRVKVSESALSQSWIGNQNVVGKIAQLVKEGKSKIALDGWYGVDFEIVVNGVKTALEEKGDFVPAYTLFKSIEELKKYKQPNITDDPGFGYVNSDGKIEDLMDDAKVDELCNKIKASNGVIIVYGYGSATEKLIECMDTVVYFDKTMQSMQWQMWDGEMIPFGMDKPDDTYNWKEFNYCDFYLLYRHKKSLYTKMDYYVEAVEKDNIKMVSRTTYDEIISKVVKQPIKQVQIFQPGPWGAYRYRDLWDIPGLECSAWNKMSGPEMSVVIDFGGDDMLNIPLINLLQYNAEVTGPKVSQKYPDLFPLDIWLDDGYFEKPQPAERISMPIHNHPDSSYVERHFNEPLGRYETYYIAEAYEGANTWMGYHDDCDLEAWEKKCRESNNLVPIEDWKEYVCNWKSNVGDLYLIPPGTAHGHGGNQMVLEMDTSPSIAGTEYSFFQYDFARNSWDDNTKTMTGKPLKMHLEHGFDNERYRRESFVKDKLRARPEIVTWNKEWYMDRYSTLDEMPFDVERLFFDKRAENTTDGRFLQILTLTVGHNVTIRSKSNPELSASIERLQCIAIPACFGDYEIISEDGSACTVVCFHLKDC